MSKEEAMRRIKQLRDEINDSQDDPVNGWTNQVCHHLDAASDVIEFPK